MKKSSKFSPEAQTRALVRVQAHRGEYPPLWAAIESTAPKIGGVAQTLLERVVPCPEAVRRGGHRNSRRRSLPSLFCGAAPLGCVCAHFISLNDCQMKTSASRALLALPAEDALVRLGGRINRARRARMLTQSDLATSKHSRPRTCVV